MDCICSRVFLATAQYQIFVHVSKAGFKSVIIGTNLAVYTDALHYLNMLFAHVVHNISHNNITMSSLIKSYNFV